MLDKCSNLEQQQQKYKNLRVTINLIKFKNKIDMCSEAKHGRRRLKLCLLGSVQKLFANETKEKDPKIFKQNLEIVQ